MSVTGVMRPLTGTEKLAIMFQLYERPAGATAWTLVSAPTARLGVWITPPDVTLGRRLGDVWNVPFEVANLAGPAAYRFRVSFRWTGARGRVLAIAQRTSVQCRQPELRPDLTVSGLSVAQDPLHPRLDQFTATLANLGLSGAGPFTVELSYTHAQAAVTKDQTIVHLAAHGSRPLQLAGALCDQGTNVTLTADPAAQVDVYTRSQARLTVPCPAPALAVATTTS